MHFPGEQLHITSAVLYYFATKSVRIKIATVGIFPKWRFHGI